MLVETGIRLGPYEMLSRLGAGGMGEVFRARDTRLDREVAIKVLSEHLAGQSEARERFHREARAISLLSHPNICTLYDVGTDGDQAYLVMELLEGEMLSDLVSRGPLPRDTGLRYAIEIARALECAHRHGIVHRDLKPANIMITRTGVKLLDFGLARLTASARTRPEDVTLAHSLTAKGMVVGTLPYMSPEQLQAKPVDERTDIFAFGCILFEIFTGRRLFDQLSQASLISAIMSHERPQLTGFAEDRRPDARSNRAPMRRHVDRRSMAKRGRPRHSTGMRRRRSRRATEGRHGA